MEIEMPIYTTNKIEQQRRKEVYLNKLRKIYPNLPELTKQEYEDIKTALEKGNKDRMDELIFKTLYKVIDSTASVYAKYDIDEIVPIEDGAANAVSQFVVLVNEFDRLPRFMSQYLNNTVNYYVYKKIFREHNREMRMRRKIDVMNESELVKCVDKQQKVMLDDSLINQESFEKALHNCKFRLKEREVEALRLKFGFVTGKPMTDLEIAQKLNISRCRADQIVKTALEKLSVPYAVNILRERDVDVEI